MKTVLPLPAIIIGLVMSAAFVPAASAQGRYAGKNGWYKGNTHLHTNRVGGGDLAPGQAAKWYHDNDYDYIVLTEHRIFLSNQDAQFQPRRPDFLIIAGEEFNSLTGYGNNHATIMNATGALGDIAPGSTSHVDFFNRVHDLAVSKGGYPIINHPTWARQVSSDQFLQFKGYLHFELFNGCTDTDTYGIFGTGAPAIEPMWDTILTRGGKYYGVGTDDFHQFIKRPEACNPGSGFTMLKAASPTYPNILDAYKKGRFYATSGVILKDLDATLGLYRIKIDTAATRAELLRRDTARFANPAHPVLTGTPGFKIDYIGPEGRVLKTIIGDSAHYQVTNSHAYVRARVTFLRDILPNQAPYDNSLHQADYVKNNNLTKEEYYAWGQPFFTDARREGPALVFGCTDSAYLEYDPKANVLDSASCKNRSLSISRAGKTAHPGEGGFIIAVAEEYGDYAIEILTLGGKTIRKLRPNPSRRHAVTGLTRMGLYVVKIRTARKTITRRYWVR
jgi:hypothetical protein